MSSEFQDKSVLIVGGSGPIGLAIGRYFASFGAVINLVDESESSVNKAVDIIVSEGGSCIGQCCHMTNEAEVVAVIKQLVNTSGSPFLAVNCPNFVRLSHFTETTVEQWDSVIENNLKVTFLATKTVLPHILGTGGSIVNITGVPGVTGVAYSSAFAAASAGIIQLTKSLAIELQDRGVRINAVALSGADEEMLAHIGFPAGAAARHLEKIVSPLGVPSPDEVAALVAYLGGAKARCITGTVVALDGGLSA